MKPFRERNPVIIGFIGFAVIAMLLPGTDPVTMLISMVPLYLLYEGSILLARVAGRPHDESINDPPTATPDPG